VCFVAGLPITTSPGHREQREILVLEPLRPPAAATLHCARDGIAVSGFAPASIGGRVTAKYIGARKTERCDGFSHLIKRTRVFHLLRVCDLRVQFLDFCLQFLRGRQGMLRLEMCRSNLIGGLRKSSVRGAEAGPFSELFRSRLASSLIDGYLDDLNL
jgi:hypothetical protein